MTSFVFEASGKIALPSQEALAAADQDAAILAYASGTMEDGRPFYAYVAVRPSLYREFYRRTQAGDTLALGEYGTILAGAFAAQPSPEIVQLMQEQYGFDHRYEEKLLEQLGRQQVIFLQKKEEERIQTIVNSMKQEK